MKIKLIGPLTTDGRRRWKKNLFPLESLSLPAVAALIPDCHEVSIYDIKDVVRDGSIVDDIFDADIAGVSVLTPYSYDADFISEKCRERGVYSVHGGVHASALPEESKADTVFIGEVEDTWKEFLNDFEKKKPKRYYVSNGKRNNEISLPEPRRDLLPKNGVSKLWDYTTSVEYSRGCPYRCEYCCVPLFGKGYSVRPVKEVVSELKKLKQKYILFTSNNFVGRPEHTKQLLREMTPLGKKWMAGVTPESVVSDPELIKSMRDAGCIGLFYGFESLSKEYLKGLKNPKKRVESYETCIKMTTDAGIAPEISFMFGSDYDDYSVFENVLEFTEKNKIPLVSVHMLTPFPGTKLYRRLNEEGRILDHDFRKYDTNTVVFQPKLMEPEELQEGYEKFLRELYSPTNSTKRLWNRITLQHPWVIPANLGYYLQT